MERKTCALPSLINSINALRREKEKVELFYEKWQSLNSELELEAEIRVADVEQPYYVDEVLADQVRSLYMKESEDLDLISATEIQLMNVIRERIDQLTSRISLQNREIEILNEMKLEAKAIFELQNKFMDQFSERRSLYEQFLNAAVEEERKWFSLNGISHQD